MSGWEWQSIFFFFFPWEPLHLTSCWHQGPRYCQHAYFPKGPELCDALLCQDFLVKILICLPSRLQSGFCLARTTRLLGKGFLGIISFPGYSHPFLVIQYQNNTLYSCNPPCSSSTHCWWDHFCTSQISILTSHCNNPIGAHLHHVFLQHYSVLRLEKTQETLIAHNSLTNMLMKWNVNLLGDRVLFPLPGRLPFGFWWPLFDSVPRHWHLVTMAKKEREPERMEWHKHTFGCMHNWYMHAI